MIRSPLVSTEPPHGGPDNHSGKTDTRRHVTLRLHHHRLALVAVLTLAAQALRAQHEHDAMTMPTMMGPLGIPFSRMGSGTSWLPDSSAMHAIHRSSHDWTVMVHGVGFVQYDRQGTIRGDQQLGVTDWEMVMAMRPVAGGLLHLHAMTSIEALSIGARGYPLLLQTGETYRNSVLHDRQHPHDLFM